MSEPINNQQLKIYSGAAALPIRLRFWLSVGKYVFQRSKYPLFTLNPLKGGYFKTLKIRRQIKLNKILGFDGRYFFTIRLPHWPSKPFDHMIANGGFNIAASGTPQKPQIDYVILAITRKCGYACKHCYEHFNLGDEEFVPVARWKEVIAAIQDIGAGVISLSGGEPMMRFDGLLELLSAADKDRSDFHLHTSGHGVTLAKARELKKAGLVAAAVGLDDVNPERYDALRGYEGAFGEATQALTNLGDAGILTYANMCLTKDLIRSGDLWSYYELAKDLNLGAIQVLEPRPCGGYFSQDAEDLMSDEDRKTVTEFFDKGNTDRRYKDYPQIAYIAFIEAPERLGCMMGGLSHFHIDSLGHVTPCVFLPVSFGNILEEDLKDIYARMREAVPHPLHIQCPSILLADTLRTKQQEGSDYPTSYNEIQREWEQMYKDE